MTNQIAVAIENALLYGAAQQELAERKQAEQALKESEARYRTLFNHAQDIFIIENAQHQILDANQAASHFYGYPRQELLTMTTLDLLPSPKKIQEFHPVFTSQNVGKGTRFESLIRRRNGSLVPVEITMTRLQAGEQTAFLSIIRDITEHKRTEEELQTAVKERTAKLTAANEQLRREISERERVEKALRESEEKYRTLIEQSSDAIYLIYNGKFEIINRRFEELFGLTLEMVNRPDFTFTNIIASKSRKAISESIVGPPNEQKQDRRYEFTALDKAGNPIEIEVSVSYPSYRGGLATQGIIRDITARRHIEEAKQKAYQQAQEYAAELATRIQEEQRQRKIATILAEVVGSVSLTLSTDELLHHILLKLQQLILYDSASIFLVKEDQLVIEAAYGFETEIIHNQHRLQEDRLFQEMQVTLLDLRGLT